jgi:hypothetical protein
MKASELRIGNYVYDTLGKVNTIDLDAITYIVKESQNQVKPIPLTEEWLLKFGFKKYPNRRDTFRQEYYDSFQLVIDEHTIISFSIPIGYNDIICNYDKLYRSEEKKQSYRVKHIHQLQNLYFALTGEELTFKSEQ